MTWGEQNTEEEAWEQLDYALQQGINFIDTGTACQHLSVAVAGSAAVCLSAVDITFASTGCCAWPARPLVVAYACLAAF
jgi:predicted aldo/keto reductase-like oxidoreductase